MSKRPNTTTKRIERRAERDARRPGSAPRGPRQRTQRSTTTRGGRSIPWVPIIVGAVVIGIVGFLIYAVTQVGNETVTEAAWQKAMNDSSTSLPGLYVPPHPGGDGIANTGDDRDHFAPGRIVPFCTQAQIDSGAIANPPCYTSNPPTSGPHSSSPQGFGNLDNPAPKENIIHSMEHGGVYIWYNTTDQAAIDLLKGVVNSNTDRRRFVGSTIYADMEPNTVAITAWTRIDKFPVSELTKERLQKFIDEHHKRFNPEGF